MSTGASFYDPNGQVEEAALHDQQAADADMQASTDPVKQATSQVTNQVKQAASNVANQAQQVAQSQAATQKDRAVTSLHAVSDAVTQVGQQLRQNNQDPIAQVADVVAGNINQLADYLRQRDIRRLINDVEDVARRQPALFLGGAFMLGLLGARFLKSSASSATDRSGGYSNVSGRSYGTAYPSPPSGAWSGARTGQGYNQMPAPGMMPRDTHANGETSQSPDME